MIALTILPLTPARYMLRNVLITRNSVNSERSRTSMHFQPGITMLTRYLIRWKNIASTFPLPPYSNHNRVYFLLLPLGKT